MDSERPRVVGFLVVDDGSAADLAERGWGSGVGSLISGMCDWRPETGSSRSVDAGTSGRLWRSRLRGRGKKLACFINSFYYFFSMTTTVTSKNMITIPMEIARKFGVKPGFSFDWFDTGRPDEIAIRVIPDRKELSRRLKGAGKSYSPLRDSVHELLQERSEEMA